MKITPYFWDRDLVTPRSVTGKKVINSMGWSRLGGPSDASITVYAGPQDLVEMANLLRCRVELRDENDNVCWWGYVHEVAARIGVIEIGASLASMYNRVAVTYSYVEPGTQLVGQRKTTAWQDDLNSQAEYGKKELMHMGAGLSDAAALATRAALVAQRAWPQGSGSQGFGAARGRARYSGAQSSMSATLLCKGWYSTLGWNYAAVATPTAGWQGTITSYTDVYATAGSQKHAQSFTTGSTALQAISVAGHYKKTGAPADNLVVALQADSSGAPSGVNLVSGTIAASTLTAAFQLMTVTFGSSVRLEANTTYWIVYSRSGALDAANYCQLGLATGTGYSGVLKTYNGTIWGGASIYTAYHTVTCGEIETTIQIADIARNSGQFLTGQELTMASGVSLSCYQDGSKTAQAVLEELLMMGGPNGRRLGATVGPDRRLRVYEENPNTVVEYQMDRWGVLYAYPGGDPVEEWRPPVGAWLRIADLAGANGNLGLVSDPTLQYIEGAQWASGQGARYTFRGQPGLDSIVGLTR